MYLKHIIVTWISFCHGGGGGFEILEKVFLGKNATL
jgi:hypothetical protein